jgi:hypothetical protein
MNEPAQLLLIAIQIITVIALIVTTAKTWQMSSANSRAAKAAEESVAEMQKQRLQTSTPNVLAYFEIDSQSLLYLIIKNAGLGVATKVNLHFTPRLQNSRQAELNDLGLLVHGIATMPPGYEIRTLIDSAISYLINSRYAAKETGCNRRRASKAD